MVRTVWSAWVVRVVARADHLVCVVVVVVVVGPTYAMDSGHHILYNSKIFI